MPPGALVMALESTGCLARMIHEAFCCNRRLHAISGRARASGLDVPSSTPAPLVAALAPIYRTLDGFATNLGFGDLSTCRGFSERNPVISLEAVSENRRKA